MSEIESIARRLIGEKAILDEAKVLHDQTREARAAARALAAKELE